MPFSLTEEDLKVAASLSNGLRYLLSADNPDETLKSRLQIETCRRGPGITLKALLAAYKCAAVAEGAATLASAT